MTEVLSILSPSLHGARKHSPYYAMSPDHSDPDWRPHYYQHQHQQHQQHHHPQLNQLPMLSSQWSTQGPSPTNHGPAMGGMTEVDLRMFQQDHPAHYAPAVTYSSTTQLLSPSMSYVSDATWPSDVDMATPSTAGFATDLPDGFHPSLRIHTHPTNPQSPHSSIGDFSPNVARVSHSDPSRPIIGRSITAPDQPPSNHISHRHTTSDLVGFGDLNGPAIKRSDASEDGNDDFVLGLDENGKHAAGHRISNSSTTSGGPSSVTGSNRGRKRQRIPHTAVERRYRENLNAHLEKLRQTVPAFNHHVGHSVNRGDEVIIGSAEGSSASLAAAASGMRPSKCEVLNGAIEHILCLDKENGALKAENKALRQRLDEVERWYQQQSHSGTPGSINR